MTLFPCKSSGKLSILNSKTHRDLVFLIPGRYGIVEKDCNGIASIVSLDYRSKNPSGFLLLR